MVTKEEYQQICKGLNEVKTLYRKAIEMKAIEQEEVILQYVVLAAEKKKELELAANVCKDVLARFPKEKADPFESRIKMVQDELPVSMRALFPKTAFRQDLFIYRLFYTAIEDVFANLFKLDLSKMEKIILETLSKAVRSTLVENRNFQGDRPYYEANYSQKCRAEKLWLELLDGDFDSYIEFFKEDEQETPDGASC